METRTRLDGEWTAPALRPVARWVTVTDERGRNRLEMVWQVPDVRPALVQAERAVA